ncbi:MAG: tRNA(Ile)-lysidine synthetase [Burkholderiaceae bacterium]|jgi:tRNA(Ile)-lysidine synthase|nr:MAG: tRNA(Ile)-lysidine synthetase [Burkholderiaceae bacterium]
MDRQGRQRGATDGGSFDGALRAFSPELPLGVAYSGGADSSALLLGCVQRWPGQVHALHVHHGLQSAADAFEAHCRVFCDRHRIPLVVRRVQAAPARGTSPEDAARTARYEAFAAVAQQEWASYAIHSIAIAQQADDQAETVLLALTRGAGLPGLSAMPDRWERGGITYHRPLLRVPAARIRAWLREQGEAWIDDPTNADQRYTRNRIRARLMPALDQAFPQFRETFARSAAHMAQAEALLRELAAQDLAQVGVPPLIDSLRRLPAARQANLLRHWLRTAHGAAASSAQLGELLRQIAACRTRAQHIHLKVGDGFAERRGERLDWYNSKVLL